MIFIKKKAIILGGSYPHIDLAKQLKLQNFYTYLIDYYENTPTKKYVDEHVLISTFDIDRIRDLAVKNEVSLVLDFCLDPPMKIAYKVSEDLGLKTLFSYQTCVEATEKSLMKEKFAKYKIPSAGYIALNNHNMPNINDLSYPIVIKPADSTGSQGISIITQEDQIYDKINLAYSKSRTKNVILEEYVEGTEYNIYSFIKNGKPIILSMAERIKVNEFGIDGFQLVGTIFGLNIKKELYNKIYKILERIVDAYGFINTPLMSQMIIRNAEVYVVEIAPRLGGGDSNKIIKMQRSIDLYKETLSIYCNKNVSINLNPITEIYVTNIIYSKPGIFNKIVGLDEALKDNSIVDYSILKTQGMIIEENNLSQSKIASIIVSGKTAEEINKKINKAFSKIDVYNDKNESIMIKDLIFNVGHEVSI